jgi:hypothetical protein
MNKKEVILCFMVILIHPMGIFAHNAGDIIHIWDYTQDAHSVVLGCHF